MSKYFLFNGLTDDERPKRVLQLFLQEGDNPNLELINQALEIDIKGCAKLTQECERLNAELEAETNHGNSR